MVRRFKGPLRLQCLARTETFLCLPPTDCHLFAIVIQRRRRLGIFQHLLTQVLFTHVYSYITFPSLRFLSFAFVQMDVVCNVCFPLSNLRRYYTQVKSVR